MKSICRPSLILDKKKVFKNIRKLTSKAYTHEIKIRPHFKTHQSIAVGRWFREQGIHQITVSTLDMATYFATDDWNDITVAFSVNVLEINKINELAKKITLNILVENTDSVQFLKQNLKENVGVFIKIDTGYNRAGIQAGNHILIDEITQQIDESQQMKFKGFIAHSGHTYNANNIQEIKTIHEHTLFEMRNLKAFYAPKYPNIILSIGDTPACSISNSFEGIDEIRPGNFVFYDVMQFNLGSCTMDEIAIVMAAPVVSKYKNRNEIMVYCGADHLSKDSITINDKAIYGYLAKFKDNSWEILDQTNYVKSLSQVHGLIHTTDELFESINVGDLIGILPVHSCLTANIMKYFLTTEDEVLEMMPPLKP
ncbi:MAG: alanine racemase [Bacteroidales bacterium]|nr:alanine racemase [Bacteroidales bacterium]